jgi:hypothetical protein
LTLINFGPIALHFVILSEAKDLAILAEWLGANLRLQGLPRLTQLPPATRLFFAQGATLVVAQANAPCTNPGKIIRDYYNRPGLETLFPKAAHDRRGLVASVEKPG